MASLLTETMKRGKLLNQLGRIVPFDVLRAPLETVEIHYHLQAAFAFAKSSAELSFFPDHGAELDELLVHADSAMDTAKDMTEGSFVIFKKRE